MDIKKFIVENLLHDKGFLLSTKINSKYKFYQEHKEYFDKIYQLTSKIPQQITLKERVWLLLNDLDDIPKCPICNNYCVFNKNYFKKGYSKYCSVSCSRKAKKIINNDLP